MRGGVRSQDIAAKKVLSLEAKLARADGQGVWLVEAAEIRLVADFVV